jgi:hypothetical protein
MAHDTDQANGASDSKDVLYLMGGLALMVLGAGLVMANSSVRKSVGAGLDAVVPGLRNQLGSKLGGVAPDIQKYLRLRSM